MIKPAIVVVGYNRPDSLRRLLKSLGDADYNYDDISLVISLDKSDNEEEVKKVADEFIWIHGEKNVRTFDVRQGLKKHILQCGDLSERYGAVIILEDDLFVAPDFYNFTVAAVNYYKDESKIAGVGLYSHEWNGYAWVPFQKRVESADVFAGQFSITWGQCWTNKHWKAFRDWLTTHEEFLYCDYIPERINRWSQQSWGKFFVRYIVDTGKYYIIPNYSMTTNFSDMGQHSQVLNTDHQVQLWERHGNDYRFEPFEKLVKYDIFFEPVLDTILLFGISQDQIEVDLNCSQGRKYKKRYVLTTAILPYKILSSFSMSLRPIECNVIKKISGEGIFLYDTSVNSKKAKYSKNKWLSYNLRGYNFTQLIPYSLNNIKYVGKIKFKLLVKKLLKKRK